MMNFASIILNKDFLKKSTLIRVDFLFLLNYVRIIILIITYPMIVIKKL